AALGGLPAILSMAGAPEVPDLVVECAGHGGLREHGVSVLERGCPLLTASIGALADDALHTALRDAAQAAGSRLHLATGAIGALDAIGAARVGTLKSVTYTGRKPPRGWVGSRAGEVLELEAMTGPAQAHFDGTARDAALLYPKNANVAAAVALAGLGFDATRVQLIADPGATANIHEIHAEGDFGSLRFEIAGNTLPGNPRTSALAAMSMVKEIAAMSAPVGF
ncbi:MAG: aspartate dehydrogenase, partial [Litoreibacter sp.]|nr:aspartate dehydrogenase [Litoreibacter sp.]